MNAKQYISEIIDRSCLSGSVRTKVKKDLENEIFTAIDSGESIEQIIERMGEPDKIAADLYENFFDIPERPFREYKSKTILFGLPLIHIVKGNYAASVPAVRVFSARAVNIGGRHGVSYINRVPCARGIIAVGPKAKGVFAVGNLSAGVISIGNISAGIISIGNISAGIFSIGNLVLALLVAIGNVAAGILSAGNIVLGYSAAGNLALGKYAIGNLVNGEFTFKIFNLTAQYNEIKNFISGLDAPFPISIFLHQAVQQVLELLINPSFAIQPIIILSSVILAVILVLNIAVYKLLQKAD